MTPAEALNVLTHAASERAQDARTAGHPLTADLLAMNIKAAHEVLTKAVEPRPASVPGDPDTSPCG